MNRLLLIFSLLATTSCAVKDFKAGERFEEESPSFFMSVAPSFSQPFEYEIISDQLILRKYDGLGGYDWGRWKEISRVEVTLEQEKEIRKLSVAAIRESISEEKEGEEIIVMDGTSWYILTDFGFGPFLSYSSNNPGDAVFILNDYIEKLLSNE